MNKDITLEDLGYKNIDKDIRITYKKEEKYNFKIIEFYDKRIVINEDDEYSPELSIEELQAIYNKCKEIGWFDDKN